MITRPQPRLVDRLLPWRHILAATLVVAVFDAAFAFVVYVLIAPRVRTLGAAAVAGLLYGALIWLFMNSVVLPLGRSAHEPFFNGYYVAFLIEHAVLVGLPIALILLGGDAGSRGTSRPSA